MNTINNDIIFEILKFLPIDALLNMAVNHRFLKFTRNTTWPQTFKSKNLTKIKKILKYYSFKSYNFSETYGDLCDIDDNHLHLLKNNTKMVRNFINLHNSKIINGSPKLKYFNQVDLSRCTNLSNECFENLSECEFVNLNYCHNITNENIYHLRNCHKINLQSCKQITDVGVAQLRNCSVLNLLYCNQITVNGIKELHKCKELFLGSPNISNDCLKFLNCDKLSLFDCPKITNEGMKYGKKYASLKLMWCDNITDEGIKYINSKSLYFYKINVTDEGLKNLNGCENINLSCCVSITDMGIIELDCKYLQIYDCPKISFSKISEYKFKHLNVSKWRYISDEKLQNFRGLETVNISECNVTDEGILHLKKCKKVIMVNCFNITRRGILNLECNTIIICECMNLNVNASNVVCVSKQKCLDIIYKEK